MERRSARHARPAHHSGINHLQQDLLFIDKGTQRGATHDIFIALENDLNKQLAKDKKLKQRHLKLHIVFVPVSRDNLFIALNEGKGDIAAANLTITPSREAQVDFAQPLYSNVKELLISGPASPKVDSLEQLSGQTVFVRRSSSYYESLQALNARFASESRPPVTWKRRRKRWRMKICWKCSTPG
jgi:ABC-type amino acid transport substrate-binding protein